MIVRSSATGRTIILVSGEVKFIRIFADHPSEGIKVMRAPVASENLINKWCKIGGKLVLIMNRKLHMSFRLVRKSDALCSLQ